MIENELRLGNLVTDYDGVVLTILSIEEFGSEYDSTESNGIIGYGLMNPIPLTGEWLEKFDIHKDYIFDNEYKRDIDGYLLYIEDIASCNVVNWDKPIKYVHEAQNLYFALTGNELEIKK